MTPFSVFSEHRVHFLKRKEWPSRSRLPLPLGIYDYGHYYSSYCLCTRCVCASTGIYFSRKTPILLTAFLRDASCQQVDKRKTKLSCKSGIAASDNDQITMLTNTMKGDPLRHATPIGKVDAALYLSGS